MTNVDMKIEIEAEEFTEELTDEALDLGKGARLTGFCGYP